MQLIIPFASFVSVNSEAAAKHLQGLKLPHLRQVLDALTLVDSDIGVEESFSPPHERALARALGLPVVDGVIPWAAQEAAALGLEGAQTLPWSFVTLCHADVGTSSMVLQNPDDLAVTEAESHQLLQAMQPYFAEDGLALHYLEPTRWLCCGEGLRGVRTASLDRVLSAGLDVDLAAWQPQGAQASKLRRLQNEMQMLLYTHTVNDVKNRTQVAAINSIFLHGTGDLLKASPQVSTNIKLGINMPRTLADAALKEDWPAWAQAWEQLDATFCAALLQRSQAGEAVVLTLCGERSALRYESRQKTVLQQVKGGFRGVFSGIFGMNPTYLLPKQL